MAAVTGAAEVDLGAGVRLRVSERGLDLYCVHEKTIDRQYRKTRR